MKKLRLKKLPWPLTSIYFIEANEKGIEYGNQTGGCACNHPNLLGFLYEFAPNSKRIEAFNPDWWYAQAYRKNGTLHTKHANKIKVNGYGFYDWFEAPARITNKIDKLVDNHSELLTWNKLKEKIERALNRIKPKDVAKVEILGDFYAPWHYPSEKYLRNEEAWVHAKLTMKNGKTKTGVFTWENCD
jgi:hypothetical protein